MVGYSNNDPQINSDEVENFKWMAVNDIKKDIESQPNLYTAWFKIIFEKYYNYIL